jgi:hypothetical protein
MNRRSLFLGLAASVVAAPAVVHAASLMPVRGIVMPSIITRWTEDQRKFNEFRSYMLDDLAHSGFSLAPFDRRKWNVLAINPSPRPIADESV